MKCELCGAQIKHGKKIMFMGTPIIVCDECAVNGRIIGDVREQIAEKKKQDNADKEISPATVLGEPEYEIVENFSHKIKDIREKKNLKQEDFAKHINEPVAYVKRIESGFVPPIAVIEKIEQFLNINLIKKRERVVLPKIDKSKDVLTLGDVVVIKKK
ncbi:putative Predicted transcription factor (Eukaryotic MBF1 related) [groundwater metagenome]|uniref:Putative Predicted transcription factor (Eukaryotic MBF1 related) n=1 Tax=groundwater metagenome TaxID=717931 RepID=A0A098E5Z0_9ZZZZ